MKKVLVTILTVILVVLILAAVGVAGFWWYRDTHVFVDDVAYRRDAQSLDLREEDISLSHYDQLQAKLPECQILWMVPFQNGKLSSDTRTMTLQSLSREDMDRLSYFPELQTITADFDDYAILEELKAVRPDLTVSYQVDIGGSAYDPDTAQLVLEAGDYTFDALLENLKYLPQVTSVTLKMPELTVEQVEQLREAYQDVAIVCTVEILGQEYDTETTALDLSAMASADVAEVAQKLALLPGLTNVELLDAGGTSRLTKADVKTLQAAAPGAVFHYTFDFFGVTISTADEEVLIKNTVIGDENEAELRLALDLLPNCKRFVLDNCHFSNEVLSQIRDDYREQTKVVWRVWFGKGSTLTDAEILRAVYDLLDDNCHDLVYCEDVRYMDIGHNEWLDACDFVAGMPNLEYCIISGAPIKDLTPFQNCKKLKVLEAAFCEYIESVEPLAGCESLERLNISYTHVTDLSPLDNLNLVNLCAMYYPKSRVPQEEQERFIALKPDCLINFVGDQPYGSAWRYDEDNNYLEWYAHIREIFRYDIYPKTPNHVGWYVES